MKLDIATVAFLDEGRHRIPAILGRTTLLAGKETAPRLYLGRVEGIGLGPYLEKQRIDARMLHGIEQRIKIGTHPGRIHFGILGLIDGLYPKLHGIPAWVSPEPAEQMQK